MPLRAIGDTGDLQAFELSAEQWQELKGTYKALALRMPCCNVPAVPKTSPLGNFFFAHAQRGDCSTAPESAEHLFCKALIARTAQAAGWRVTTERPGVTPDGAKWVADVFCEKGSANVALEVQLAAQTREELLLRQARYKDSGVRAAWFYAQKLRKDVDGATRGTPLFGLTEIKVGQEPTVGGTKIPLTEFVAALLSKRVAWVRPSPTDPFYLAVLRRSCSNCRQPSGLAYGHANTLDELSRVPESLAAVDAALARLFTALSHRELASLGMCHIAQVHNVHGGLHYMNICQHCRGGVRTERLLDRVYDQARGQANPPQLESVYFDRNAQDSGAWAYITEDGEYRMLSLV